jgi:hypothetical protein
MSPSLSLKESTMSGFFALTTPPAVPGALAGMFSLGTCAGGVWARRPGTTKTMPVASHKRAGAQCHAEGGTGIRAKSAGIVNDVVL